MHVDVLERDWWWIIRDIGRDELVSAWSVVHSDNLVPLMFPSVLEGLISDGCTRGRNCLSIFVSIRVL